MDTKKSEDADWYLHFLMIECLTGVGYFSFCEASSIIIIERASEHLFHAHEFKGGMIIDMTENYKQAPLLVRNGFKQRFGKAGKAREGKRLANKMYYIPS